MIISEESKQLINEYKNLLRDGHIESFLSRIPSSNQAFEIYSVLLQAGYNDSEIKFNYTPEAFKLRNCLLNYISSYKPPILIKSFTFSPIIRGRNMTNNSIYDIKYSVKIWCNYDREELKGISITGLTVSKDDAIETIAKDIIRRNIL